MQRLFGRNHGNQRRDAIFLLMGKNISRMNQEIGSENWAILIFEREKIVVVWIKFKEKTQE